MNPALKAFAPLLLILAVVLVAGGAFLSICFGYAAWQVLFKPQNVTMLTYILQNIADTTEIPAMTATIDGRTATYVISKPIRMFGLCYLFIVGLGPARQHRALHVGCRRPHHQGALARPRQTTARRYGSGEAACAAHGRAPAARRNPLKQAATSSG